MQPVKKVIREVHHLQNGFVKKIKTPEEIKKLIGDRPRKKKVVMCHGTFDIVHPGHLRQLIYAKSKGDILVVSLTCDEHVHKGPLRPYVPEKLRALNLAAFELVDHVLVDQNPTPLENIRYLQPDYFVKGFEYSLNGIHPKTKEEMDVLTAYGGKILFSPGDIIFSSTKLLAIEKPNLSVDHLLTLIEAENITFPMLREVISKFPKIKIHIVGDIIVDKYSRSTVVGVSQKAPALQVQYDSTSTYVGGAGVLAKHFKGLGAKVILTTVVGKDENGEYALTDLKESKIRTNAIPDPVRLTMTKERFLDQNGLVLFQVDRGDNTPLPYNVADEIYQYVKKVKADAVVLSDFRHGIFNKETIQKIVKLIPKKSIKVADSQVSNRWGNILDFQGFDLITPNERETRFALADQETTIRPLAQKLYNEAHCRYLILKLGKEGILSYRSPGMENREYFYIDTFCQNAIDPIGAGDALLAAATLGLITTQNILQASILGNLAACVECSTIGNVPVTTKDLLKGLNYLEERAGK